MTTAPVPTPHRPEVVVFDVVETLFSLDAVAAALERAGVGREMLDLFFARMLRDAFALGWRWWPSTHGTCTARGALGSSPAGLLDSSECGRTCSIHPTSQQPT